MNKEISDLYYCRQCKAIKNDIDSLLFVEEDSTNGFCKEVCIETFYEGLVNYFSEYNKIIFSELGVVEEKDTDESLLLDHVLNNPSEVWCWENQLGTKVFHYLGVFQNLYVGATCFVYGGAASFVLGLCYHSNKNILSYFRKGRSIEIKKVNSSDTVDPLEILNPDQISLLEEVKAEYLAKILEVHSDDDIGFENYGIYDELTLETIQSPDFRMLVESRSEGEVHVVSKMHKRSGKVIYYSVLFLIVDNMNIPILCAPSFFTEISSCLFGQDKYIKN